MKNPRSRERLFVGGLILIIILGGAALLSPTAPPRTPTAFVDVGGKSIPIYGGSEAQIEIIRKSFDCLSRQEIKKSVRIINVLDWLESYYHFEGKPNLIGDCHFDGEICFNEMYLDYYVVWHEVAHAYNYTLPGAFKNEWLKTAGDVYAAYPENEKFPQKGLLTWYGGTDWMEDVAEWIAEIYYYIAGASDHYLRKIDVSDRRYLRKLDLLLKWGFISKEDYNHIKPLLE